MITLDLHGIRHHDVQEIVHNFINDNWGKELRIITGNSNTMKTIVCEVLNFYNLSFTLDNIRNLGYIIVRK
mgnify:CR=1 FL=1